MKLYMHPGACSLAPNIVAHELGIPLQLVSVDRDSHRTAEGADYLRINPLGYVPALERDDGSVLTEGPAIVQWLLDTAGAAAPDARTAARLRSHLNFISTEIHKPMGMLFVAAYAASAEAVRTNLKSRLARIEAQIAGPYLDGETFSPADAYLFVCLNWSPWNGVDLAPFPALLAFMKAVAQRPAVRAALEAEGLEPLDGGPFHSPSGARPPAPTPGVQDVLDRFNDAFLQHDASGLEALVGEDCTIENTVPAPDGSRHEGREACLALWRGIAEDPALTFAPESVEIFGDAGIIRWRLSWGDGPTETVRGVNLMRVRDGKIVEAQGYVKGA